MVKSEDLWDSIGDVIHVPKDIKSSIKKGVYLILETQENLVLLYNIKNNKLVETQPIEGEEFTTIYTPPIEKLELMQEAFIKRILQLSSEGWTEIENPEPYDLDLTPTMVKLSVINKMLEVLSNEA